MLSSTINNTNDNFVKTYVNQEALEKASDRDISNIHANHIGLVY